MQSVYAMISDNQTEGEISDEDAEAISGGLWLIDTKKLMAFFVKTKNNIGSLPNFSKKTLGFFNDLVFKVGIQGAPIIMPLSESSEDYPQDNDSVMQI